MPPSDRVLRSPPVVPLLSEEDHLQAGSTLISKDPISFDRSKLKHRIWFCGYRNFHWPASSMSRLISRFSFRSTDPQLAAEQGTGNGRPSHSICASTCNCVRCPAPEARPARREQELAGGGDRAEQQLPLRPLSTLNPATRARRTLQAQPVIVHHDFSHKLVAWPLFRSRRLPDLHPPVPLDKGSGQLRYRTCPPE